jgi:DNA-binding CsgD family transcriptional regulator
MTGSDVAALPLGDPPLVRRTPYAHHDTVSGEVSGTPVCGQVSGTPVCGQVSGTPVSGQVSGTPVSGHVSGGPVSGLVATRPVPTVSAPASPASGGPPPSSPAAERADGTVVAERHRGAGCDRLTGEELQMLALIAAGLALDSVAARMGKSSRTIRRRIRAVCDRLGLAHPIQAVVWAVRRGLI